MPLPASTDGSDVGTTIMDHGDDCEMGFDGLSEGADDLFTAGDKEEGEMNESESEEERDPEAQRVKERLADVWTLYFLFTMEIQTILCRHMNPTPNGTLTAVRFSMNSVAWKDEETTAELCHVLAGATGRKTSSTDVTTAMTWGSTVLRV
jgi:hypothetical protein